jgi:hypothetical protein
VGEPSRARVPAPHKGCPLSSCCVELCAVSQSCVWMRDSPLPRMTLRVSFETVGCPKVNSATLMPSGGLPATFDIYKGL